MSKAISQLDATALGRTTDLFEKVDGVTGDSEKITGAQVATMIQLGVKTYRALLTQATNNAPTAVVLENSLGGTVVWSRNAAGIYFGTLIGAFPVNKVFFLTQQGTAQFVNAARFDDDVIQVTTSEWGGASFTEADNFLNDTSLLVMVNP